jgi:hypothetical protein
MIPSWWTPDVYRRSREGFELMLDCRCGARLEDCLSYKFCRRCGTAYSPVPDYEALERELILDALAGRAD